MPMSKYKQVKVNFTHDDYLKMLHLSKSENKTIAELVRPRFSMEIKDAPLPKQVVTQNYAYHLTE